MPDESRPAPARAARAGAHLRSATSGDSPPAHLVVAAALLMVAAHTAFRAWAIFPSWFFTDDYRLMLDAQGVALSPSYLLTPFDSQFMPLGRLAVWVVTHSGTTSWTLAAASTILVQLLASVACVWMLTTLFGARPAILVPLTLYLTSAITLPGFMWWAAALNQLPMQLSFFLAVGAWVRYLRTRAPRMLVATLAALALGLASYPKAVLIVPVLVWILLAYFVHGGARDRVLHGLRGYPLASALGLAAAIGYAGFYLLAVPQPFEESTTADGAGQAAEVADAMLGTSLPTGALGGPWTWLDTSPPIVLAQPPGWTVPLAWTLIALGAAYLALRRARTGRGWVLLAGYSLLAYGLLATSRGQLFGRIAGLEYRYLTDVLPVLVLAVGLVSLDLRGAVGSSTRRERDLIQIQVGRLPALALLAVVAVGGLVSSWTYVQFWHTENAGRGYVKTLQSELMATGPVDLADQIMPVDVMPEYTQPRNTTAVFVPLVAQHARFPEVSDDLRVVDDDGRVVGASITPGPRSQPGPDGACGWRIGRNSTPVPLDSEAFDFGWWVRIGYLSGSEGTLQVRIADTARDVPVKRGLNSVYVYATAEFSTVRLTRTSGRGAVCVDTVEVGQAAPGMAR